MSLPPPSRGRGRVARTDFRFHTVPSLSSSFIPSLSPSLSASHSLSFFSCCRLSFIIALPYAQRSTVRNVRIHRRRCVISNIGLRPCPWPRIGWRNDRAPKDTAHCRLFVRPFVAHSARFAHTARVLVFASSLRNRRSNGRSEIEAIVSLTKRLSPFRSFPTACLPTPILIDYCLLHPNHRGFKSRA